MNINIQFLISDGKLLNAAPTCPFYFKQKKNKKYTNFVL